MLSSSDILKDDLSKIDVIIKEFISSDVDKINFISDYIINAGGKRIRPVFSILSARLLDSKTDLYLNIAAAIEFIHTATLLHDDVVDESDVRRGKESANSKWGNQVTILVGDYLFTQGFKQMVLTGSMEVMDVLSKASSVIAEGEVLQLENVGNINATYEDYIKIISAKTAALFAAACKCSAVITEQNGTVKEDLYKFGLYCGIAFQIIDDILDYSDNSGKQKGNDLKEGKVTAPIILIKDQLLAEETELCKKAFDIHQPDVPIEQIEALIKKYDGFSKAREEAEKYSVLALEILEKFPDNIYKSSFEEIVLDQLNRLK